MATESAVQSGQSHDAPTDGSIHATAAPPVPSTTVGDVVARLRSAVASWTVQEEYAARYAQLARAHDFVEAVYADTTHGLTLYTVYRGDRRSVAPALYESYQRIIDEFPDVPADFRLVDRDRLDTMPLPETARPLFRED